MHFKNLKYKILECFYTLKFLPENGIEPPWGEKQFKILLALTLKYFGPSKDIRNKYIKISPLNGEPQLLFPAKSFIKEIGFKGPTQNNFAEKDQAEIFFKPLPR